jgi:MFS family permease
MVPPAALAIHLSIGQAYAFSVFNVPMTRLLGITHSLPDDWKLTSLGWIFSIAIVFLGLSAAFAGKWVEDVGPRKAMFTAACCFGGGFLLSALGVKLHNLWLTYLGYGVIGGCGLGIGYISPVRTLLMWFPDRPGTATGLAIMGFGGGALIAAPLSIRLMRYFTTPASVGVAETFVVMAILYVAMMLFGAFLVRIPPPDRQILQPATAAPSITATGASLTVDEAMKTPQFYLVWLVLCLNVTAGIGVLGQASAMSQEMFPTRISASTAAGFVGLLSLFNMIGRVGWSSLSDYIGRKTTYSIFFLFGIVLYALVPLTAKFGEVLPFVVGYGIIISMYGGGFAAIPAYLRDLFGTRQVGAIHGRVLTAWSLAGVLGPVLVNYIRQYQIDHGVAPADAYTFTMRLMAGLLAIGLVVNLFVTKVDRRHYAAT